MTTEQQATIERGVADSEGRVPSTEERVSYIEGALPELARRSDVAEIRVELAEFRTEVRTELAGVKVELAEFRTESRTELAEFRTESKTELAEFKNEVRTELADVKADVAVLDTRLDRVEQDVKDLKVSVNNLEIAVSKMETRLVRWMIGVGALVVGAIAASQILFN